MQWGLMKQGVILPHKFTANTLWTRSFHDHDFDTILDNLKIRNSVNFLFRIYFKCSPGDQKITERTRGSNLLVMVQTKSQVVSSLLSEL